MFKPNTYTKNVISMPQQLLNRPQLYLLMHFNNWNTNYSDNCQACDTVKLLPKSVIGLQQKAFWWASNMLKSLKSICFLTHQTCPFHSISSTEKSVLPVLINTHTHKLFCMCAIFVDRDVKSFLECSYMKVLNERISN